MDVLLSLAVAGQWMPDDEPSWFESLANSTQNQICQIYGAPVQSGQGLPKSLSSFFQDLLRSSLDNPQPPLRAGPSTMTKFILIFLKVDLRRSGFIFLCLEFIIYGKLPFEYTYGFLERIND